MHEVYNPYSKFYWYTHMRNKTKQKCRYVNKAYHHRLYWNKGGKNDDHKDDNNNKNICGH